MDPDTRSGVRAALACYTMWGGFTAYWKLLADFPAIDLIGWRMIAAGSVLVLLVVRRATVGSVLRAVADATTRRHLIAAAVVSLAVARIRRDVARACAGRIARYPRVHE